MVLFGLFLVIQKSALTLVNVLLLLLGASSSHSGIDIPAPEGTKFIAVADGKITFRNFLGAGGYTITLSFDDFKVSYCHCDPNWIVSVGDEIKHRQDSVFSTHTRTAKFTNLMKSPKSQKAHTHQWVSTFSATKS